MIHAPVTSRDALLHLIHHWNDLHALRWVVVELAETVRQREEQGG